MKEQEKKNERWKMLVLNLKEKAIDKWGSHGWQTKIAELTPFARNNIGRMFGLDYSPSLKNYTILAEVIGLKDTELIDSNISKFLVSVDQSSEELYILHREEPCYLVHVVQETPMRFVLIESYDEEWNDEKLLLHPSILELKKFIQELSVDNFLKN
ncbi:hypothetical protein [Maribacter sp.]|uniref:hypothetical protein n=1 Tax=Maribacter sp. TaxID=1897614 RepID=UPI0025BE7C4B|nr:hypothetical protein [Maribacter sp.]